MTAMPAGHTYYNIIRYYDGVNFSLETASRQLRSLRELAECKGVEVGDEPLEIWSKGDELGFFLGDTSTLADEGWKRNV